MILLTCLMAVFVCIAMQGEVRVLEEKAENPISEEYRRKQEEVYAMIEEQQQKTTQIQTQVK